MLTHWQTEIITQLRILQQNLLKESTSNKQIAKKQNKQMAQKSQFFYIIRIKDAGAPSKT